MPWSPVADVVFGNALPHKVWRHSESELTLEMESINTSREEVVLKTNLPAPYNKLRLSSQLSAWAVPMTKWRYRVELLSVNHYDSEAVVRIERQSKP